MRSIFCTTPQTRRGFLAEAAQSISPNRRDVLAAACACGLGALIGAASALPIHQRLDAAAVAIEGKMLEWRRDFHQNPELGNQEYRTAKQVARHLRSLGYEVRENIAVTGQIRTQEGQPPSSLNNGRIPLQAWMAEHQGAAFDHARCVLAWMQTNKHA